jgi:ribosomal-protein-alanine N-acetyltransferase
MYGSDAPGSGLGGSVPTGSAGAAGERAGPEPLQRGSLGPDHLEACLALDGASLDGLWTPAQWRAELSDGQRLKRALWRGPQLVAMACGSLVLDELHITLVAVRPSQRRQGLGSRVLQDLLSEARRRGAGAATLEVAATNAAALGLYSQLGFRILGRRRGYYRDGADALIQWATLTAPAGHGLDNTRNQCG